MRRLFRGAMFALAALSLDAAAVVTLSTGDPAHNTNAPSGALTGSGWQYQGTFGDYVGTPISSRHFLTAKHMLFITNSVNTFLYGGQTYTITDYYANPTNDLVVVKVAETFASFAPLYTNHNETGRPVMMLGRGWERGEAVTVGGDEKGWLYGYHPLSGADPLNTKILRWGTNTVSGLGGGGYLVTTFSSGRADEAHLGPGDSGGGMFVLDPADNTWKLAGINYTIDAYYSTNSSGTSPFWAALYDSSGLYVGEGSTWNPASGPSASYATRVSTSVDWINSVVPEPSTAAFLVLSAAAAAVVRRHRRHRTRQL
ncbi:MAG: PEP-CTERM sorting domain-containing protein [Verrucomicrobia bacterium]|nr:PEP-CTERM sorting domain-containing protein [Verrucomicrobiota bacterium]